MRSALKARPPGGSGPSAWPIWKSCTRACRCAQGAGAYDASKYPNTDPASNPWFYLDTLTGVVSLTAAGANAQCIGQSHTITVQAVANGRASEQGEVTFTLTAPTSGNTYNLSAAERLGLQITDTNSGYDMLRVNHGANLFTDMQVLPKTHSVNAAVNSLFVQVSNNFAEVANHFAENGSAGAKAVGYLTFTASGTYYGYSFGTAEELSYYWLQQAESTTDSRTVNGTACNDLLFGSTAPDGHTEYFYGGDGTDLIFADP
jgi:hypothetical protein